MSNGSSFSWPVRIYYEDTDAGGIVYYANYLRFAERARTEWLRQHGIDQHELWEQHGAGFVVRRAAVEYRKPARLDDLLDVGVAVSNDRRTSLSLTQTISRGTDVIALVEVDLVCVNQAMRPVAFPKTVKAVIDGSIA